MRTEVILKREDKSRVKIIVGYDTNGYTNKGDWSTKVFTCDKGKRTWKTSFDCDICNYYSLSRDERREFEHKSQFNHVTEEELLAAKLDLWYKIKPE